MADDMASPDDSAAGFGNSQEGDEYWFGERQKRDEVSENNQAEPKLEKFPSQEMNDKFDTPTDPIPVRKNSMEDRTNDDSEDNDDDDDDDDGVVVTIDPQAFSEPIYPGPRGTRMPLPTITQPPIKTQAARGVDVEAQGMIAGQPTMDFDINGAFKDEEKPWKKPGADISDYFNYGFTEETWTLYCDRQRRLRAENNLARLNTNQMMQPQPIMGNHPPMIHPMPPHQMLLVNKSPINPPLMNRPYIPIRKAPDGKIDVIGATTETTRRPIFEGGNAFDHMPFPNAPGFPAGQPANGQTVGDLVTTTANNNGPPAGHGTPTGANHPIQTLGGHRLPMMPPPGPGMQFRPPFVHPHMPGAPPFFPHPPGGAIHGDRPQQPYFMAHHQQQQPWEKPGMQPVHNFNQPGFPGQAQVGANINNGRAGQQRSSTPEDESRRSSTPEENRPTTGDTEADKNSKDSRYKDRYKDDREHHSLSRRRSSPKEHSGFRSRHRSGDHEYERPRGDRKSSRERDDKYERYSRKRHHREEGNRHHRGGEDDPSRSHRSSRRSPSKNFSSPPKMLSSTSNPTGSSETSQGPTDNSEPTENEGTTSVTNPSSSPNGRSRREDSERSSSRHGHHKKSSKRSRRDSGDERSGHHHRRRSKEKSSSNKKSSNSTDPTNESKEQINE